MDSLNHDNQAGVIEAFNSTSRYLNDLSTFLVVLLMVYTFRNLLGLLESAIMLRTSTLEINV